MVLLYDSDVMMFIMVMMSVMGSNLYDGVWEEGRLFPFPWLLPQASFPNTPLPTTYMKEEEL